MATSPLEEMVPTWAISCRARAGTRGALQPLDDALDRQVDAALDAHRVVPGGDELQPLVDHRLRQHGCGGGAVASQFRGASAATSRNMRAPRFSIGSSSSISRATADAGVDHRRAPYAPLRAPPCGRSGPSVTLTASASLFRPAQTRCRASSPNTISLPVMTSWPPFTAPGRRKAQLPRGRPAANYVSDPSPGRVAQGQGAAKMPAQPAKSAYTWLAFA